MRPKLISVILSAALILAVPATNAADPAPMDKVIAKTLGDNLDSMSRNLKGIKAVEYYLSDDRDAKDGRRSKDALIKFKLAGLSALLPKAVENERSLPWVVQLVSTKNLDNGRVAVSIDTIASDAATFPRTGVTNYVAFWRDRSPSFLTVAAVDKERTIDKYVTEQLDRFLRYWLKQNPRTTAR